MGTPGSLDMSTVLVAPLLQVRVVPAVVLVAAVVVVFVVVLLRERLSAVRREGWGHGEADL